MGKIFYTEHDIEDLARRGQRNLVVGENVVLTDLAYESARKLGVELIQPHDTPPGAPIRPYINQTASAAAKAGSSQPAASLPLGTLKARVKSAVKAKLGDQVDDALLERIIERVAADLGLR